MKTMLMSRINSALDSSEFVAVFHYSDMSTVEWNSLRSQLNDKDISVMVVPFKLARKTLQNTKYENMMPLFYGSTAIAYSHQPQLAELFAVTKTLPKFLLLGGLVENELMTPQGIQKYSELPDKITLQHQLLSTLMSPVISFSHVVSGHSLKLIEILKQYELNRENE